MNEVLDFWFKFSIFDESSQTWPKYQKGSLLNFSNILRKSNATAFVFYCDAKHSDTLLGSSHVCCYLFLGSCGQKSAWSLNHGTLKSAVSWESELIKWTDVFGCWYKFRKADVNLVFIGWVWSKNG